MLIVSGAHAEARVPASAELGPQSLCARPVQAICTPEESDLPAEPLHLSRDDLEAVFFSAKNHLRRSVEKNSVLPEKTRRAMLASLEKVQVNLGPLSSWGDFYYPFSCGTRGKKANAYFHRFSDQIVVCPGLLQALSRKFAGHPDQAALQKDSLFITLAHELGHSIDAQAFPKTYEAMSACLLGDRSRTGRSVGRFLFMPEISADFWAVEALVRKHGEEFTSPENLALSLSQGYRLYCADTDETLPKLSVDRHPPGGFRIQALMHRPEIRILLGCEKAPIPSGFPVCDLYGR